MKKFFSQDKNDWQFTTFPIWRQQIYLNFNVLLRLICKRQGHVEDVGFGIGAQAPIFCRRCWKTLGHK